MLDNDTINSKQQKLLTLLVLLAAAAIAFTGNPGKAMGDHESYVSVTARNMLETNNFLLPCFNSEIRLEKTPLCYWLVAISGAIFGQINNITARLPSIILAIASTGSIIYFIKKCLNFRIAIIAAMMWTCSLSFARYTHTARPEMALTAFVTIAMLAFYTALQTQNRKTQIIYMLIFWISFALSMLAKGPAPLPLMIPPLALYIIIFRKFREIPKMLPIIGPIIFLLIVMPWPIYIINKVPSALEFWKREYIARGTGDYASGDKPFYYYFKTMFPLFVPWVAFIPIALPAPFFKVWQKKRPAMWFLWFWFVFSILAMTFAGGKRQHYILPSMPAIAILAAITLEDMLFNRKAYPYQFCRNILIGHMAPIIIAITAAPVVAYIYKDVPLNWTLLLAMTAGTGTAVIIYSAINKKPAKLTIALFATITLILMIVQPAFVNPKDDSASTIPFAKQVQKIVGPEQQIVAYKYITPRFIHHFERSVPKIQELPKIKQLYNTGTWILTSGKFIDELNKNTNFKMIKKIENAEVQHGKFAPAALYHKAADSQ